MDINWNFYNYDGLVDVFKDFFDSVPQEVLIFALFFLVVLIGVAILLYVFSSLGIMAAAKKNKLEYPWLAFVPIGRIYLIGKLGFEVYPPTDKKNPTLTWVLFGLSIATFAFNNNYYINLVLTVFLAIAFYNIFRRTTDKYKVFTVFTVLLGENLAGLFLYTIKDLTPGDELNQIESKIDSEENEEEVKETKEEEKEKTAKEKPNYCPNCGAKISKNAKFCTNCGKEIK